MGTGGELPELRLYLGEQRRKRRHAATIGLVVGVLLGWFGKEPLTHAWRQVNEPQRSTLERTSDGSPSSSQSTSALRAPLGEHDVLAQGALRTGKSASDSAASEPTEASEKTATTQGVVESADVDLDAALAAAPDTAPAAGRSIDALPNAVVDADRLNMRAGPSTSFAVVETLMRGVKVVVIDDGAGTWVQIQSPSGATGYVARDYLSFIKRTITLEEAYGMPTTAAATCVEAVGVRNGAMLEQRRKGPHTLRVENGTDRDGVVKLKSGEETILAFYVKAGQTAEVAAVPDGTYRVQFETGRRWSENCRHFQDDVVAMEFDNTETFQTRQEGSYQYFGIVTYTLHRVSGGDAAAHPIPLEDF
jgi:uncharacterized protein YgiM (DUF1202 family)